MVAVVVMVVEVVKKNTRMMHPFAMEGAASAHKSPRTGTVGNR